MEAGKEKPRQVDAAREGVIAMHSSRTAFSLSVVTALRPTTIGKRFALREGRLTKSPGGVMVRGRCERLELAGLPALAELLPELDARHALMYGLAPVDDVTLITTRKWNTRGRPDGPYPRTKDAISWPAGPGLWMLDYDPEPGADVLSREEFLARLIEAEPALAEAGYVWYPSSSSHIVNSETGEDLTGLRGQRLWFLVNDARGIPGAGEALLARLWTAGHGYIKVSKSGALLDRTLVDGAVWQPERLDFAGGAACGRGLHQNRGAPVVTEGSVVDLSAFVPADAREVAA